MLFSILKVSLPLITFELTQTSLHQYVFHLQSYSKATKGRSAFFWECIFMILCKLSYVGLSPIERETGIRI